MNKLFAKLLNSNFINLRISDLKIAESMILKNHLIVKLLFHKNIENDLDIYFAVGNANTLRQEKKLGEILKIRNY